MMATTATEDPGPSTGISHGIFAVNSWRASAALAALFFVLFGMAAAGCAPRIARVEVSPEDVIKANGYVREGNEAYREGDYYAALIKYLMASELNPNSGFIRNFIGIAYLRLDYHDQAIEAFKDSLALNSKFSSAVNNLGSAYFASGNFKKAEKYYKKAIKMKEDDASFHMNLGTLYFEMKKTEKAIREWRTSVALDPNILDRDNPLNLSIDRDGIPQKDRYYFMARVHAVAGDVPKMIESLEKALLNGFSDIEAIRTDKEFDPYRKDERFLKFMESATAWDGAG